MRNFTSTDDRPTPLPTNPAWMKKFNAAMGDPDPKDQARLAKTMEINDQSGVGELIWAMTTCCPDMAYTSVKLSQANSCPYDHHFHGVKHALKYLNSTKDEAYTFGELLLAMSSRRVRSQRLTALSKTYFWIIDRNMMRTSSTRTLIQIGPLASKHVVRLARHAFVWQVVLLLTSVSFNLRLLDLQLKRSSWLHMTQVK